MVPVLFSAELTIGSASPWRWNLEHDPGLAGGKRGEMLRWTGAATNLHLGPLRVCLVWKETS